MRTRFIVWGMCLAMICLSISVAQQSSATKPGSPTVRNTDEGVMIEFPIAKGQYWIAGYNLRGSKILQPLLKCHHTVDGSLVLGFSPGVKEENLIIWRHTERFTVSRSADNLESYGELRFKDEFDKSVTGNANIQTADIPIKLEEDNAIDGSSVKVYRVEYAKVGEDVRSVVIAIADNPDGFSKLFEIPRTLTRFSWDKWAEIK